MSQPLEERGFLGVGYQVVKGAEVRVLSAGVRGSNPVPDLKAEDLAVLVKNFVEFVEHFPELGLRKEEIMKGRVHQAGTEIQEALREDVR